MAETKNRSIKGKAVLVAFPNDLLVKVDKQARQELLSRSALLRRIARDYISRQGVNHVTR